MREPLEFRVPITLRWRDIDMLGHLNQAVYHELLEEARAGLLSELAGHAAAAGERHAAFVMRRVELDYHHEVRKDHGEVTVTARADRVGTTSVTLWQEVILPDGTVAASGASVIVAWDPAARGKRTISAAERAALGLDAPAAAESTI